jgi:energy-coupling factor transporter ATP-binding protein EcfA2
MPADDNFTDNLEMHYKTRANSFSQRENYFSKRGKLLSFLRLVPGIFIVLGIYLFLAHMSIPWLITSFISFVIFFIVAYADSKANKQRSYFGRLKTLNEQENAALKGEYTTLPTGACYIAPSHPYSYDLDIFGTNSLFQNVNRTCTTTGERLLVDSLTQGAIKVENTLKRQEAILELTRLLEFRQQFVAIGQENQETANDLVQLNAWLNAEKSRLNRPLIRVFSFLLPSILLSLILLAIFGIISYLYLIIPFLLNLAFVQSFRFQIDKIHAGISNKHNILNKYAKLLELINRQTFSSEILTTLWKDGKDAHTGIKALSVKLNFFDARLNDLVSHFLNGTMLFDLHCIAAIDAWKIKHREQMPKWLDSIFLIDELSSFANFAFNNPGYSYPKFSESTFFEGEDLGHPLIRKHPCIKNNFASKDGKVIVLSGANMSGKSTFLRTIGINMVLAYSGAPVFATKFICNNVTLYTSMRVTDSLGQDTSYFYAEINRLSLIADSLREGKRMLILLDEILKGTNSADKLQGSIGLIQEFLQYDCLCVIATHDLALGELEHTYPNQVSNYCFESQLEFDQLSFDYTINKGIAKNKNATFLMQRAGLIKPPVY